jgi:hypothetical protein
MPQPLATRCNTYWRRDLLMTEHEGLALLNHACYVRTDVRVNATCREVVVEGIGSFATSGDP